ncbi:hypothetical protein C8F04DRAFT_1158972 [Mycena alexandri]|uniref:DUF6534 domain-containing protein n=1 Tax=Mycena alexandri TaxID=1745969 RepID=A0AAD6WMM4_9AGAR|nr:hypothetical protein C8F04DRAFT_1158972 [Mycena alexandri]
MPYYTNNLGLFLGIILAGSWLNLVFYTTEIILFVYHLPRWTLKPVYKYGSYALLANDAVGTFAVCANAFLCAVDGPVRPLWPSHVLLISTALAAFMEQSFLIHRYYRVAIGKVMSIFLMLIASAHLVFAVIAFLFDQKIEASTIGAILCSFVDLLIALSICWSLSGIEPMWRSTQQLIRVLCINALASGTVVAAVTLLSSATTIAKGTNSIIFTLFYASNGRIYSLTILVNIIIRNAQRDDENTLHVTQFVDSVARLSLIFTITNLFTCELQVTPPPRNNSPSRWSALPRIQARMIPLMSHLRHSPSQRCRYPDPTQTRDHLGPPNYPPSP